MSKMEKISVESKQREELVEITRQIKSAVRNLQIQDGSIIVYVPHTTAGVVINESADPSVGKDIVNYLGKMIPKNSNYLHTEGNSDAHIKASILGNSQIIPISDGDIVLGTWQGIFFAEFDGPRSRKVLVGKS